MADDDKLRDQAKKQVAKRRDLGAHIVTYCVINAVLVGFWAMGDRGYFWPAWVLLGWGVGLVLNVWDVYFRKPITEHDIEREMERMRGTN